MQSTAYGRTDIGCKRDRNQDAIFADDGLGLYIVCDGMGGYEGGEVASVTAIDTVVAYVRERRPQLTLMSQAGTTIKWLPNLVAEAIKLANSEVCLQATRNPMYDKMGTTLTMILVHEDVVVIGHCGDSRAYCVTESLELLTTDHTMGAQMRDYGWEEDMCRRHENILTQVLGRMPFEEPEIVTLLATHEMKFLLCSDGLSPFLGGPEVNDALRAINRMAMVEELIELALAGGGPDNISAIVVEVVPKPATVKATAACPLPVPNARIGNHVSGS